MYAKHARVAIGLILAFCAPFLVWWRIADGQTWQWQVVIHNRDQAPVNTESRLVLSARDIGMDYAARLHDADVPIASCHASLPDVSSARIVNSAAAAPKLPLQHQDEDSVILPDNLELMPGSDPLSGTSGPVS